LLLTATHVVYVTAKLLQPTREVVRPANQLQLTEQELSEEVAKMLTANNPAAPQNVARFNMKERCYKFEPMVEQLVVHYGSDGWLLHKCSDEAKKQLEQEKAESEAAARFNSELERALKEKEAGIDVEPPDDSRQLRNQFNFSERAAQTFTYPLRDRATFTEPPPTATVAGLSGLYPYQLLLQHYALEKPRSWHGASRR
jgi:dynein intermediate chain 1